MQAGANGDEFRERLGVEMDAWRREGLVTPEQARAILARYGLRATAARAVRLGPVATFLSVLGAIVFGTGVVYFFAANWEVLPAWNKVALVFSGTAAAYAAGYWMRYRWGGLPRVGAGLILLGAILFQAGIFLLEQIYNMPVDSPLSLLLGAIGILPLAYAVGSRLVLTLGLVDGLAWLAWELSKRYPDEPESFAVPLMLILAGVLVYAASHWHRLRRDHHRFAPVYEVLGLVTILVPAYVLTFGDFWEYAHRDNLSSLSVPVWFAGTVLLAVLAGGSLVIGRRRDPSARVQAGVFAAIGLIVGLVAYVPEWAGGYALVFNVVYFGLALLACVHGYLEGEARFVNLGIPVLALGLITRYVDVFWDLLPLSAFFVVGGIVLLGVAAGLERLRQRLLSGPGGAASGPTTVEV
jgi:uncharacterized membrane protein